MKFIHCADIHLGSKMEAKLPAELSEERRRELRATFSRMVDYARAEEVTAILLAGDVFDSARPLKRDKEFFYSVVRNNPDIDFLYLRGNHDNLTSYTEEGLDNLKTFGTEWRSYSYGNIAVHGIELSPENRTSLYTTLQPDRGQINLVMLHGDTEASGGDEAIDLTRLRGRGIDYLALGHIHRRREGQLDERGDYAYPGCLEGRGFDEIGQKGFILLEIGERVSHRFIPFASREIVGIEVDLSGTRDEFEACRRVAEAADVDRRSLLRVELAGEIEYDHTDLAREIEAQLSHRFYFVSVKDHTRQHFNPAESVGDISLRGEFIRTVLGRSDCTEEEKQQIIEAGLRALSGREVEL